jgi:hypothetical protein
MSCNVSEKQGFSLTKSGTVQAQCLTMQAFVTGGNEGSRSPGLTSSDWQATGLCYAMIHSDTKNAGQEFAADKHQSRQFYDTETSSSLK